MESTKKDCWTKELDNHLRTLITFHGTHNWSLIAANLNSAFPFLSKSAQDCYERWSDVLESSDPKKPWKEEEELKMLIVHQKHQNKWSNMAQELPGRSNNSIKNRFYSIFRKVKNKVVKHDVCHDSKIELLETLYMIFLMEVYFARSPPAVKQTGKRGKDFIFSLLKGLHPNDIKRYKLELLNSDNSETSLDKLWFELVGESFTEKHKPPKAKKDCGNVLLHITTNPPEGRSHLTLPSPRFTQNNGLLTPEEKHFIYFQVFQNKELYSAGICSSIASVGVPYLSSLTHSINQIQNAPAAIRFEDPSSFTEKKHNALQPHITNDRESMQVGQESVTGRYGNSNSLL